MSKIQIDESQNIEYKESWNDKYLEWICGFANAQGGKIYIGVNDDHEIVGVSKSKQLMEDIPNKIVTHLGIVADVNLLTDEGLDYIEIVVAPSNMPISYHGQYHYRSGSTKQELRGLALQQFILKKLNVSWDATPCASATINDIDDKAVTFFVKRAVFCSIHNNIGNDQKDDQKDDQKNVGNDVGISSIKQLTERQRKIYRLIAASSTITVKQMSVIMSVTQRTIERDLATMQKNGSIRHEGKAKTGHWVVLL